MDNILTIISLHDYFKPTTKVESSEKHWTGNDISIQKIYNKFLDFMADKTINFLDNL